MPERALSRAEHRLSLAAIIASISVFAFTLGLSSPILALILEAQGISAGLIGLNSAMTAVGILISAPFMPPLTRRLGIVRFMLLCMVLCALLLLALRAVPNIYLWFPLRIVLGFAISGLFVLSETWINEIADEHNRGRLIGLYVTVLAAAFAAGPLLIPVFGSQSWIPFLIGAAAISLAALPLVAVRHLAPSFEAAGSAGILAFFRLAPTLLAGAFLTAFVDAAALSLLPVYGMRLELGEAVAGLMVAALVFGNVIFQFPLGWLGDHMNRYRLLITCGLFGMAGALLLPALGGGLLRWPLLIVWGGMTYGVYALSLTLLGERFRGTDLVAGNAAFAVMWGVGGILGPLAGGSAMDAMGPQGLPLAMAAACLLFVVLAVYRQGRALWRNRAS
jgi:MFS family permease